jgi:hypothetical protein
MMPRGPKGEKDFADAIDAGLKHAAPRPQEQVFMTRQTTLLVQAFNISKHTRLKANAPVTCSSAEGARRTAERPALNNLDTVAFSVTADPEAGDNNDEPTVFFRAGQLPAKFDLMP